MRVCVMIYERSTIRTFCWNRLLTLGVMLGAAGLPLLAQQSPAPPSPEDLQKGIAAVQKNADIVRAAVAPALVFFMQAGFAMVETGFTRAKNAGNIMMKNLMDFCMGGFAYWAVGFGLMFGR